jgi:uncharacterized membrane protein YkoI
MLLCSMNARHVIMIGLLLAAPLAALEEITLNQLPVAVRRTLDREARADPVKKITRQVVNGQRIYLVEMERDHAANPRLRIAETGELVPEPTRSPEIPGPALDPFLPAPVTYPPAVTLGDLPDAVQRTARAEARGREIGAIDRETWQGRTVYEIEFRSPGRNPQVHIAEDGSLVRGEAARRGLRDFFPGTQLADTPTAVQTTIRREAAGRPINDIDVERRTGEIIYEVEIVDPHSGAFQLHIGADGRILKDARTEAPQPKP